MTKEYQELKTPMGMLYILRKIDIDEEGNEENIEIIDEVSR